MNQTIDEKPVSAETLSTNIFSGYPSIALVGNPNVGKSVLFHCLTGKYVTVSNFPGTTVDLSQGLGTIEHKQWSVIDTPGVVSLHPRTEDECVTRDLLLDTQPDVIVQVADAKNPGKVLQVFLELSEYRRPMVLALNMMDEAVDRGLSIDVARLEQLLGVPVVGTVAITGEGIPELKTAILKARLAKVSPRYDSEFLKSIEALETEFDPHFKGSRPVVVSLLLKDPSVLDRANKALKSGNPNDLEKKVKWERDRFVRSAEVLLFEAKQPVVQEILGETIITQSRNRDSFLGRLGNMSMRPFPGFLIAGLALFFLYEFVGVFGAGILVNFLERNIFGGIINPFAVKIVNFILPFAFLREALVGPYGIVTMAFTYALALILPIVTTFFLYFSFLEDSGYLPRLAVMMDRFFRIMGLNGRAVLPMVLGLGCDTMATVTTRILDTKKEKVILSLLLTLAVPCSAQLGAILGMSAGLSVKVLMVWFAVTGGTMMLVGWGAARLLPGSRSPLLLEIPPLRWPKFSNIFKKVKARLKWYLKEVIPLFVVATFILFLLDKLTLLQKLTALTSPIVVHVLGLPAKATEAFLIGFFRRDYGAAGFFNLARGGLMNVRQVTVSMVVITLFMPCIAHVLITIKERGWKISMAILAFVMSFSLIVGGLLNWILVKTSFL